MHRKVAADFRGTTNFATMDEVDLFRALAKSIVKYSPSTFVDETHGGNVCNVKFTSVVGNSETCEIADLLIISCGSSGQLRATFWQAKKQDKSKWLSLVGGDKQFDFKGQFNQWDLLCRRPMVAGVARFRPPADLLSSFGSSSIGTIGVFYKDANGIQVNHSVAEFVGCSNPKPSSSRMTINGYISRYSFNAQEVISRTSLDAFLEALFACQIGAPLDPSVRSHAWLLSYVSKKIAQRNAIGNKAVISFGGSGVNTPQNDLDGYEPEDGLSVLVVVGANGA